MSEAREKLAPKPGYESAVEATLRDMPLKLVLGLTALFSTLVPSAFYQITQVLAVLSGGRATDVDEASFVAAFFFVFFLLPLLYVVLRATGLALGSIWTLLTLFAVGLMLLTQVGDPTPSWVSLPLIVLGCVGVTLVLTSIPRAPPTVRLWSFLLLLLGAGVFLIVAHPLINVASIDAEGHVRRFLFGFFLVATGAVLWFLARTRVELPDRLSAFLTGLAIVLVCIGAVMLAPRGTHLSITLGLLLVIAALAYGVLFLIRARKPNADRTSRLFGTTPGARQSRWPRWVILVLFALCAVLVVDQIPAPTTKFLSDFGSIRAGSTPTRLDSLRATRGRQVLIDSLLLDLQTRRSRITSWTSPPYTLNTTTDSIRAFVDQLRADSTDADSLLKAALAPGPVQDSTLWGSLIMRITLLDRQILAQWERDSTLQVNTMNTRDTVYRVARIYLNSIVRDYVQVEQALYGYRTTLAADYVRLDRAARRDQARMLKTIQTGGSWLFVVITLGLLLLWGYASWSKTRIRQDLINLYFFGAALHLLLLVPLLQEIRASEIDVEHPIKTMLMSNWFLPRFFERNIVEPIRFGPAVPGISQGSGGAGPAQGAPPSSPLQETDLNEIHETLENIDVTLTVINSKIPDAVEGDDSITNLLVSIDTTMARLGRENTLSILVDSLRQISTQIARLENSLGATGAESPNLGEIERQLEILNGQITTLIDTLAEGLSDIKEDTSTILGNR